MRISSCITTTSTATRLIMKQLKPKIIKRPITTKKTTTTTTTTTTCVNNKLPILDISLYYTNQTKFIEELRVACHQIGFFLLKHDIPSTISNRILNESKIFFQRPMKEKQLISYEHSSAFRGYMKLGVENTSGYTDYREQIEYAVEYNNTNNNNNNTNTDTNNTTNTIPYYDRLKSTNPWPDSFQPTLRESTLEYSKHICRIADCLRDSLCLALDLDPKVLSHLFPINNIDTNTIKEISSINTSKDHQSVVEPAHWQLKLVSYPQIRRQQQEQEQQQVQEVADTEKNNKEKEEEEEFILGVGEHTDTNFLTLVLQDTVGGLEAFSKGEWISVPSEYGNSVLICNLGEQAEILSNGYFLATPHRVVLSTSSKSSSTNNNNNNNNNTEEQQQQQQQQQRISVPFFYNPILSATIEPLIIPDTIPWERSKDYITKYHWKRKNNTMLSTVGDNLFKSLARSHPNVFNKFHPDLSITKDGKIITK